MYTLRQITPDGIHRNQCLGSHYSVIYRQWHGEKFTELLGKTDTHPDQHKVFAIVLFQNGSDEYPLYSGFHYYIMTESGKTFERISDKG